MTKPWLKVVVVAWLAGVGIALAEPPAQPSQPSQPIAPPAEGDKASSAVLIPPPIFPPAMAPCPKPGPVQVIGTFPPWQGEIAWASVDYQLLWIRPAPNSVPLLTTTTTTAPAPAVAGALNDPLATVLVGSNTVTYDGFNGAKVTAGLWFNFERDIGFEASGFLTQSRTSSFGTNSNALGSPFLAVPFFDVNRQIESAIPLAVPNRLTGGEQVSTRAQFGSAEGNFLHPFCDEGEPRIEMLCGFRYLTLQEKLAIQEQTGPTANFVGVSALAFNGAANIVFPNVITYQDQFKTRNNFYGGQVGVRSTWNLDRWFFKIQAELAAGVTDESIQISGSAQRVNVPGGPVVDQAPSGIFAQASNIGSRSRTQFAVLPSAEVQVGFELFPNKFIQAGYSFMYLSKVVRPGNEIDHSINTSQAAGLADFNRFPNGPASPAPLFSTSEFWAHGLEVGFKVTY
jgi:hypothetical protein